MALQVRFRVLIWYLSASNLLWCIPTLSLRPHLRNPTQRVGLRFLLLHLIRLRRSHWSESLSCSHWHRSGNLWSHYRLWYASVREQLHPINLLQSLALVILWHVFLFDLYLSNHFVLIWWRVKRSQFLSRRPNKLPCILEILRTYHLISVYHDRFSLLFEGAIDLRLLSLGHELV